MFNDKDIFQEFLRDNPAIRIETINAYNVLSQYDILIEYKSGARVIYDLITGYQHNADHDETDAFPYLLQKQMMRNGYSQRRLAEDLGVSQQTISNYMNGYTVPNYLILIKLSKIFNCNVSDFFISENPREKHALL